jgi:hypothetical protein
MQSDTSTEQAWDFADISGPTQPLHDRSSVRKPSIPEAMSTRYHSLYSGDHDKSLVLLTIARHRSTSYFEKN